MSTIIRETETTVDSNGQIIEQHTEETYLHKDNEPDYVKIYTDLLRFKQFPCSYRELFLQLAIRMSYCSIDDPDCSQIVYVMGPHKKVIMSACGWQTETPLVKGLKALCDCGAIRRVSRGIYQINPSYAAKGSWKFNKKNKTGGVKDLREWYMVADRIASGQIVYDNECMPEKDDDEA